MNNLKKDLEEKLQKAEIEKQIIEEQIKTNYDDYKEQIEFVSKIVKIVYPDKKDEEIIKCIESVIKDFKKSEKELQPDTIVEIVLLKLKQPKKKLKQKINSNPQQVGNFIS